MKAATGEDVTAGGTGGADVHTRLSGVADYLAEDDDHAEADANNHRHPQHAEESSGDMAARRSTHDPQEIYGIVNADVRKAYAGGDRAHC
jgi:3-methylcrotonyl-CoA carboxylase beta subunit